MDNIQLLFDYNKNKLKKIRPEKGINGYAAYCRIYAREDSMWTGYEIKRMIAFVNQVTRQFGSVKIPIVFDFGSGIFIDKLTYIFVECICYYLSLKGYYVQVFIKAKRKIGVEGLEASPLLLLNNTSINTARLYLQKFCKDIYQNHYRRVIKSKDIKTNVIGDLYTEVDTFLKLYAVGEVFRDKVSNTVSELVGNAIEHAEADCLLDIDVTTPYGMVGDEENNQYYGVNIAVVNFSPKTIGEDLKNKMKDKEAELREGRYGKVLEAYRNHSNYFSDSYLEDDFYNISAFQHKISGRKQLTSGTGGTGLTKLIKALQEISEAYRCYVISGTRALNFHHEFLEYNKDGWIGFNNDNNYFESIPQEGIATECFINMPGTAYNLNFIFKEGNDCG